MKSLEITVVKDFNPHPKGRDEKDVPPDGKGTGKHFRESCLEPAMKKHEQVHVTLDGYNRYGPSFLDEAFAGLIHSSGIPPKEVFNKLTYSHSTLKSIEDVIKSRINSAATVYLQKNIENNQE